MAYLTRENDNELHTFVQTNKSGAGYRWQVRAISGEVACANYHGNILSCLAISIAYF